MRASMLRRLTVSLSIILASVPRPVTAQDLAALRQEIATAGGRVVVGIKPATAAHGMVRPGVRALSRVEVQAVADRSAKLRAAYRDRAAAWRGQCYTVVEGGAVNDAVAAAEKELLSFVQAGGVP